MTVQRIDLGPEDIVREAPRLTAEDFDRLPFGTIYLDLEGTIRIYNRAEEALSGRRRDDVIGRNFFSQVAPCTRVKEFYGLFRDGVARGRLNEIFDFTFRFTSGPKHVRIRMIFAEIPFPGVWLFVTPINAA